MTKFELIEAVALASGQTKAQIEPAVNAVFEAMTRALVQGDGVEIRGFGSFTVRQYKAYEGRNPRTGEAVHVAPKRLPYFKVGKDLHERLNAAKRRHDGEAPATATANAITPEAATPASQTLRKSKEQLPKRVRKDRASEDSI